MSIQDLQENFNTLVRIGVKWDQDEDDKLMDRVKEKMNIGDIAHAHQRTIHAVKVRIMSHAFKIMKEQNISVEEVSEVVSISIDELKEYITLQECKSRKSSINKAKYNIINAINRIVREANGAIKVLKEQYSSTDEASSLVLISSDKNIRSQVTSEYNDKYITLFTEIRDTLTQMAETTLI